MTMIQDGVEVYCLPDGAICTADEEYKNPLELDTWIGIYGDSDMFSKLKKKELQEIYLDYICSKKDGRRCESFVPFAEQYKEQKRIGDLMSTATAIDIVTEMFFEEVANRYIGKLN